MTTAPPSDAVPAAPNRGARRRGVMIVAVTVAFLAAVVAVVVRSSGLEPMRQGATGPASARGVRVAIWGSSSAERMARQADLSTILGVPVYNGGRGGQLAAQIAARQGGSPAVLEVAGHQIPGSGDVAVSTSSFPFDRDLQIQGTLVGVRGRLKVNGDSGYVFARDDAGSPVPVDGPVPLISDGSVTYSRDITLLWMGKNDLKTPDWEQADAQTWAAWTYASRHSGRVLVLGHFADTTMVPGSATRTAFDDLEQRYRREYGDHFLDVQSLISSKNMWTDLGIAPTAADRAAQQAGTLPPSLDDGGHQHLTTEGYRVVAEQLVLPKLRQFGWL